MNLLSPHPRLLPAGEGHDYMDVVGRATQEAKAEDEGRCYAASPHPGPRQPLPATAPCVALPPHIHVGRRLCPTSCIHAVVPQGEGVRRRALFDPVSGAKTLRGFLLGCQSMSADRSIPVSKDRRTNTQ